MTASTPPDLGALLAALTEAKSDLDHAFTETAIPAEVVTEMEVYGAGHVTARLDTMAWRQTLTFSSAVPLAPIAAKVADRG